MATVIRDNLWLCDDCSIAACNADFSAIDNPERENTIRHGLAMLGKEGYPVANNDSETGEGILEFSRITCDCCGTKLHGSRSRFCLLTLT